MSAPVVSIHRLSATAHLASAADPESADPGARIGRLLAGVAERRLDRALSAVRLPPGTWCLKRLDVPVRLDLTAPDPAVEERWAATLAAALAAALHSSEHAVRYAGTRDALADLVAGIAVGRTDHAWAWRQLGLLQANDAPDVAPSDAVLAAIRRHPEHAVAAVVQAVERVGIAALDRVLGAAGWTALADVIAAAVGADPRLISDVAATSQRSAAFVSTSPSPAAVLAARLVRSSRVAAASHRSVLRPPPGALTAWAVLVTAEVDPSVLRRAAAPDVLAEVAGALTTGTAPAAAILSSVAPAAGGNQAAAGTPEADADVAGALTAGTAPAAAVRSSVGPATGGTDAAAGTAEAEADAALPAPVSPGAARAARSPGKDHAAKAAVESTPQRSPETADVEPPDQVHRTACAGVFFLLATAQTTGVPEAILDEPAFATRTLPWVLHQVAIAVGVPAADPAAAAFAGLDPGRRLPWLHDEPATPTESKVVDAVVRRWSQTTAATVAPSDEPAEVVAEMVRRAGVIGYEPGWLEVHLPLSEVDLDVRRAGLDLDPGWVPWLGMVVRYVYE